MSTKILAITNQKGGVAKTTTAVNVAACAAETGRRVLVVDADPQASATSWLTEEPPQHTLWNVFEEVVDVAGAAVPSVVAGVDVLGAEHQMHMLERLAGKEVGMETMLAIALREVSGYDLVLIDCPGTLDLLTVMALVAAQQVVIPVVLDVLSLAGVDQLMTTIDQATRRLNPSLVVGAVVPVRYRPRQVLAREVLAELVEQFGDKVTAPVRESVRAQEAAGHRQTLTTYAPTAPVTDDYRAVTSALLKEGEKR